MLGRVAIGHERWTMSVATLRRWGGVHVIPAVGRGQQGIQRTSGAWAPLALTYRVSSIRQEASALGRFPGVKRHHRFGDGSQGPCDGGRYANVKERLGCEPRWFMLSA